VVPRHPRTTDHAHRPSAGLPCGCQSWVPLMERGRNSVRPWIGVSGHAVTEHFRLRAHLRSNLHLTPWPRAIGGVPQGSVMSQCSKMRHSRNPATLFRGPHQLSRRLARPGPARLGSGYPASTLPPNPHPVGDPTPSRPHRRGPPLEGLAPGPCPFCNGLIWMSDISIGLGSGQILAGLALDAHPHQLVSRINP